MTSRLQAADGGPLENVGRTPYSSWMTLYLPHLNLSSMNGFHWLKVTKEEILAYLIHFDGTAAAHAYMSSSTTSPARGPWPAVKSVALPKLGHGKLYPQSNLRCDGPLSLHKCEPKQVWVMHGVLCLSLEMFTLISSSFMSVYRMSLI